MSPPDRPQPRQWFLCVVILAFASRIPFLWLGYSEDPDAWLVAHSAKTLWNTGSYSPSRLPGFPLHEIVSAPFVALGGAPLSNSATLFASIALLFPWWTIVRRMTPHPVLALLPLAFAPVIWTNATVTMDYLWALLFIIVGLLAALGSKPFTAGIAAGVACGFRPSSILVAIPLAIILHSQGTTRKRLLGFFLVTLGTCLAAYSPLLLKYGLFGWVHNTLIEMSDVYPPLFERITGFLYRSIYWIGLLATIAVGAIFLTQFGTLKKQFRERDPILIASLVGIGLFLLLFLVLPVERSYLIPVLPFLCLIIARSASRTWQIVFVCALVSFALFNPDIISHTTGPRSFQPVLREGRLAESWQLRGTMLRMRERIPALPIEGNAVVMVGNVIPLEFENPLVEADTTRFPPDETVIVMRSVIRPCLRFVDSLTPAQVRRARDRGYGIFCLEVARKHVETVTQTSLDASGVVQIATPRD